MPKKLESADEDSKKKKKERKFSSVPLAGAAH